MGGVRKEQEENEVKVTEESLQVQPLSQRKRKSMFQHADGELGDPMQAVMIIRKCSASELLDLGSTFNKQGKKLPQPGL